MKKSTVALILLLEGLASSGLQMLTIRQVTAHIGSSVLVTSIVVSTFLAALALGYYIGGRSASQRYRALLIRNLDWHFRNRDQLSGRGPLLHTG